ncbi:MAG: 3-phosphoshikimate 1-carboxyvinyltransferase [Planctomycetaceae bacterium]
MSEPLAISPVADPVRGTIRPPGSKSLTNRALVVAALAEGDSRLSGVLDCTDTEVMIDSLGRLGIEVRHDPAGCVAEIAGCGGRIFAKAADLWLENSGTSIRFLTALATLGRGTYRLDGNARMRQRPIQHLVDALNRLGTRATCDGNGCPPVAVRANGLPGGKTSVGGDVSSQYLSSLLMAAPCAAGPVEIAVEGALVSLPYVDMTMGVMAKFGVVADTSSAGKFRVAPQPYRGTAYEIEPDASAASYFFAAAAITGGEVTVHGLSRYALQGDVGFVDVLEEMGCRIDWKPDSITVRGGALGGIDVDMNAISDTAQTLAVVAPFAEGPTRIRNVGHIRHKETDRIAAIATELDKLGVRVETTDDSLTIHPGPIAPGTVATYDDHRMAMSFALVGLKIPGIRIADPDCTAKTYPQYFDDLRKLCGT